MFYNDLRLYLTWNIFSWTTFNIKIWRYFYIDIQWHLENPWWCVVLVMVLTNVVFLHFTYRSSQHTHFLFVLCLFMSVGTACTFLSIQTLIAFSLPATTPQASASLICLPAHASTFFVRFYLFFYPVAVMHPELVSDVCVRKNGPDIGVVEPSLFLFVRPVCITIPP